MDNRDLEQVALVALLQREAGGNAAEVIDQVATNIRGRMELRRLVRTLTAQGRLARWIVSLLPVALFGAIFLINRDYLKPLWTETFGVIAMIIAAIMVISGSLAIKKIVNIKV
jgi:tight adherence protein B